MKIGLVAQIAGCCVAFAALGLVSCGGAAPPPRGGPFQPDAAVIDTTIPPAALCTTARGSETLRPRADITTMGGPVVVGPQVVHTSDLFVRFNAVCGGCHVEASTVGRQLTADTFVAKFDQSWLDPIKSDVKFMPPPPNGKPYSQRVNDPNDPVVVLVKWLEAWMDAGKPRDVFMIEGEVMTAATATSGYTFTPTVAAAFTNLGNCVTNAAGFETSTSGMMESMDEFFAGAEELPQTITETDLTTFDSEVLATTGVIAYVPTYMLWSAGSGKLRHIRVPRGEHVTFDKATQSFNIPPNTRFYKTFFRKVIDRAGHEATRKMETRIIVARPDVTQADGTVKQTALFGTYIWSEDETTATLANLPYRDGTPFADQVRTYITDELAYQDIVDSVGPGADFEAGLQEALRLALERNPNLQQHYAIPGRIRCVQCHMGSPTKDFVLGFFPLQVARRANETGGTYDPTGDDELTQLQRLIDYGVISGMASPADVLRLEDSQGTRRPRTPAELTAQAYMIGNCAHCHNPRGLPSVTKPELTNVLNFLPDGKDGGVFEFPFERMSPVRQRGAGGDIPIPYITPSLRDYPVANTEDIRMDNGLSLNPGTPGVEITWTPKYPQGIEARNCEDLPKQKSDHERALLRAYCGSKTKGFAWVPAPWRSLIYRNVDSPFPYFDDYVPFPHMPMNTFGFDCRAPRIMGDWMVGLPSERKSPGLPEEAIPGPDTKRGDGSYDDRPQPYQEVRADDSRYPMALATAQARLTEYHASVRYRYCEDVLSPDIFDPVPPSTVGGYQPDPDRYLYGSTPPLDPSRPGEYAQPPIGVPYHSHFFAYDPTEAPPPWSPRRPDWSAILVDRVTDQSPPAGGTVLTEQMKHDRKVLVDAINEAELKDALRKYATTEIPYGLWEQKPGCDKLAGQPKAGDFTGTSRPTWMGKVNPPADAPVYMAAPGAMLYAHICVNCHGPKADGKGLQADALAASSEGEARPANFREGLFGPSTQPGMNLLGAFGMGNTDVAFKWAPRYMAWMALGGTLKKIPQDIIHQVEATKVFGQQRPNLHHLQGAQDASANMLKLAAGLCAVVLPDKRSTHYYNYTTFENIAEPQFYPPFNAKDTPFLDTIADRDMWLYLCTQFSPVVVRVYGVDAFAAPDKPGDLPTGKVVLLALYPGEGYPATAQILDQNKVIQTGIQPDMSKPNANLYPACFYPPSDPQEAAWVAGTPVKTKYHMPDCPPGFVDDPKKAPPPDKPSRALWTIKFATEQMNDNIARWSLRGGIATGMAVFSYLQGGGAQGQLKPYYNQCQLLK